MSEFAEIHEHLRSVAREVLGKATPLVGDGGACAPVDWSLVAEMGWLGLEVPDAFGGAGATFAEVAIVLEEMGRAAAVGPFFGTAVLGVGALNLVEPSAERDALLSSVAAGEVRLAVAVADGSSGAGHVAPFVLVADPGGALTLTGAADLVLDVPEADTIFVLATDPDGTLVLVLVDADASGFAITAPPLLDDTRSAGSVGAVDVVVAPERVLRFAGDPGAAVRTLLDRGAIAMAIDGLGLSKAMLDATVAYAGVRTQFGRAIGSFQAVKHACADMAVHIAVSEELLATAIDETAGGAPQAWVSASMAKSYVSEAAVEVAGKAMQLHGGIGYAWESGVHVYLKRATLDRALMGSPADHRRLLAERLVARSAPSAS